MDRRLTPFSGRVALTALRGQVTAETFTEGEAAMVLAPLADLLSRPGGARDRQVVLGDSLRVIDRDADHAFVQAEKDGYCGWISAGAIGPVQPVTHWVAAPASHLYTGPKVQAGEICALTMGARVAVTGQTGAFCETPQGFIPATHLRSLSNRPSDPVAVACKFLGCAYLWGGNSHAGIDCSGLVQAALLACGLPCPGDSDLQQALGTELPPDAPLRRGDLVFWKGHVAMVVDDTTLIHANGHSMSVALEGIAECIARIQDQTGGGVTARRRLG